MTKDVAREKHDEQRRSEACFVEDVAGFLFVRASTLSSAGSEQTERVTRHARASIADCKHTRKTI